MRNILIFITFMLSSVAAAAAGDAFPGVQKLMTAEEFKAAGLDKLSTQERQALDTWLTKFTATEAPALLETNEEVKEVQAAHVISANIKQPFEGWSGKTVFYLDNGQVWRQRLDGRMVYNGEDTAVEIKKNFLGFYKMRHIASDRSVGVSRIK